MELRARLRIAIWAGHLAMLRWPELMPGLSISVLLLMLLEHWRVQIALREIKERLRSKTR